MAPGQTYLMYTEFEDQPMVTPRQEVDYDSADSTHVNPSQCIRSSNRNGRSSHVGKNSS